ncbi:MAG: hypothetical protein ABI629_16895 [bacterium]
MAAARAHRRGAAREAGEYLHDALALLARVPHASVRRRRELELRVALEPVLMEHFGPASDALQQNGERAQALSEGVGDPALRFQILFGLCHVFAMRGDGARPHPAIDALLDLARQMGSAEHRFLADSLRCRTDAHRARFADSCAAGQAFQTAARQGASAPVACGADPVVGALNHYTLSSWMTGEVGRDRAIVRE